MKYSELLIELKKSDFAYAPYVHLAIEDETIRKQLIENITGDHHINIYYNSYYLVYEASKLQPILFYPYWDVLTPLLTHRNSYHRSIAHWILTNLVKVDKESKFDRIKDQYFLMIKDEKFLTGFMALKDIVTMSGDRRDLQNEIVDLFLNEALLEGYKDTQIGKMEYVIIQYFNDIEKDNGVYEKVVAYVQSKLDSPVKKTQKIARDFMKHQVSSHIK